MTFYPVTFYPSDILWHIVRGILSCNVVCVVFCLCDILTMWRFIHVTFCLCGVAFYQYHILSVRRFVCVTFWLCDVLSMRKQKLSWYGHFPRTFPSDNNRRNIHDPLLSKSSFFNLTKFQVQILHLCGNFHGIVIILTINKPLPFFHLAIDCLDRIWSCQLMCKLIVDKINWNFNLKLAYTC